MAAGPPVQVGTHEQSRRAHRVLLEADADASPPLAPSRLGGAGRVFDLGADEIGGAEGSTAAAKEVALPTQHKIDQVADLTALLQDAEIAIGASYKGMPVSDLTALRRQMNANGIQVRVVKNTLLRRAATEAGREQFSELAQQDTAILVGSDVVETARQVMTYRREHATSPFTVRNAVVSGEVVNAAYVEDLSTVPPREELIARIAGGLTGKIRELAGLLQATTREFAGLIDARASQLEGQQ